jgi:hypothetical protein
MTATARVLPNAIRSRSRNKRLTSFAWHPNRNLSGLQLYMDPIAAKVSTGGARQYTSANSEYHSRADDDSFDIIHHSGKADFIFAFHIYRTATGTAEAVFSKRAAASRYVSCWIDSSDKIDFKAVVASATIIQIQSDTAISAGEWHHITIVCDRSDAGGCKIFLDGVDDTAGTPTTTEDGAHAGSGAFEVGRDGDAIYANGRIARLCKGSVDDVTTITTAVVAKLYNSGNGVTWAELTAAERTSFGFTAGKGVFFIGNEPSGTLTDSVASLDLADNNTVTALGGPAKIIARDETTNANHGALTDFGAESLSAWVSDDISDDIDSGYALKFDGTNDVVIVGDTGLSVTYVEFYIRSIIDNQEIFTLANSTATSVMVDSGTLTFGASLTESSIEVDGVSKSAAAAGALINDNTWHKVSFVLASISASDFRMGTTSGGFGNILLDEFKLNSTPDGYWKFDDGPQSQGAADGDPIQILEDSSTNRKFFVSAVRAEQPQFAASVAAMNDRSALLYSGGQLLQLAEGYLTGSEGLFACVFHFTSLANNTRLIASSDTAGSNSRMSIMGFRRSADPGIRIRHEDRNTVNYDIDTETTDILVDTNYLLIVSSDGSELTVEVNGAGQTIGLLASTTNTGEWFGESANRDNVIIGALRHTSDGNHMTGYMGRMLVCNIENSDQIANLRTDWANYYGITLA